jgi:metal-responsive CopG/Arc/MetJ family transcriptional regulator
MAKRGAPRAGTRTPIREAPGRRKIPISITLTAELQAAISALAYADGLSRSQLIELAVRTYAREDPRRAQIASGAIEALEAA